MLGVGKLEFIKQSIRVSLSSRPSATLDCPFIPALSPGSAVEMFEFMLFHLERQMLSGFSDDLSWSNVPVNEDTLIRRRGIVVLCHCNPVTQLVPLRVIQLTGPVVA